MFCLLSFILLANSYVLATGQVLDEIIYREGGGNAGIGEDEDFDALTFLERDGFLDDLDDKVRYHAPDSIKQALKEYQGFYGLNETGRLDKPTITLMQQPRCGVPDVIKPNLRHKHLENEPLEYKLLGSKWPKKVLTYKFFNFTSDLSQEEQRSAIAAAMKKWEEVTPLKFLEQKYGKVDIELAFVRGNHGHCTNFDGKGGVVAHAFRPGSGAINGDIHFDDDDYFTVNSYQGYNLEQIAVHELGHALGLRHSGDVNAVMYAHFGLYKPNYSLSSDDIQGIQKLYGKHPEKPVCANKGIFCEDYKRRVGCDWHKEYMYTNCPKACGICNSVGAHCSRDADCKYNLYCSRDPQTINTCKKKPLVRGAGGIAPVAGEAFVPEVLGNIGSWYYPICGHYFWNSHDGAESVCKALGFPRGQMIRTNMTYNSYAMPVGQCRSGEAIDKCTGGGNRWGYLFSWDCQPGRPIGVEVVCNDQDGK